MSDDQAPCTIHDAFPLISEDALSGVLLGLSAQEPVGSLTAHSESAAAFEGVADWMLGHPSTCLGTALPGLWLARDEAIQSPEMPLRNLSALSRLSITLWGDVLEFTPSLLLDMRGFGEGSLRPFLALAASTSAEACCRERPPKRCPVIDSFEQRRLPPRSGLYASAFRRLVEWAANEAKAITVADLLAACSIRQLPEDVALVCDALCTARLADVFPDMAHSQPLELLVNDLCEVLDARRRAVFLSRISLNKSRTLEDLGAEIGLTRERVRQLSASAEDKIREALATPRFAPIGWRAHTLRTLLGTALPGGTPFLGEAMGLATQRVSDAGRERVLDLLLWLAGPYFWDGDTGWLRAEEMPSGEIVASFCDRRGRLDLERLRKHLSAGGLVPEAQSVWLNNVGKIRKIEGVCLLWAGTVTDKAMRLLEMWGRPATAEEIVAAINEGHDVRSTRARLLEDERFMRVDRDHIGLRSWGLPEYSTIAEGIDQELDSRGGSADLDDLVAALVARFRLRAPSVRLYVQASMFILEGATIRRRTSADPPPAVPPVTDDARCRLLGPDALTWRLDITADTLRGSGRTLPAAIAAWLGIAPGGRLSLTAEGGAVGVTWPATSATGPALGSIRFLAEAVEARVGDPGLLCFRRDQGTITFSLI